MPHKNDDVDARTIELMKAEGEDPKVIESFETVLRFAREHNLRCSGNPRKPECGSTPVTVLIVHGRAMALQCFDCVSITSHIILYMGHGSLQHQGFNHFDVEKLQEMSPKWAAWSKETGFKVERGHYWTFQKQRKGEIELENTLRQMRENA